MDQPLLKNYLNQGFILEETENPNWVTLKNPIRTSKIRICTLRKKNGAPCEFVENDATKMRRHCKSQTKHSVDSGEGGLDALMAQLDISDKKKKRNKEKSKLYSILNSKMNTIKHEQFDDDGETQMTLPDSNQHSVNSDSNPTTSEEPLVDCDTNFIETSDTFNGN